MVKGNDLAVIALAGIALWALVTRNGTPSVVAPAPEEKGLWDTFLEWWW